MKCKNCGTEHNDGSKFCTVCGEPLVKTIDNKYKWIILGIGIAFFVVLLCFFVWSVFINDNENNNKEVVMSEALSETHEVSGYEATERQSADTDYYIHPQYDNYIIEGSDVRYIDYSELMYLSDYELMLARNEIYARNGRIFNDPEVRNYFMQQSWYNGTIAPEDFREDMLNEVEKSNIETIKEEEKYRK